MTDADAWARQLDADDVLGCPSCHAIVSPMVAPSGDARQYARCPRVTCRRIFLVRDSDEQPWRPLEYELDAPGRR
jgi:hypothetical protein